MLIFFGGRRREETIILISSRFGKPIQMEDYLADFDKSPKLNAKLVTKALEESLLDLTVNSPDWPNRKSAIMAREMLFPGEYGSMPDFVQVSKR